MTQLIDRDGLATIASAEAKSALNAGDTPRARNKFAEAGEILEGEMREARDDETEQLLRFLAATQYYEGGRYRQALELAEKIKAGNLPAGTRQLLSPFMQDVKVRSAPDYEASVRERLRQLLAAKDYAGIIETLQKHPYVLSAANLAFIRAICCESLGRYRPAVLFFADAARRVPDDPGVLAALAPLPLTLPSQGRLHEAWEYVQAQLELFPNAVTFAVASLLCYHRAHQVEEEASKALVKEQAEYFRRAREEYARLSSVHQNHPEIRAVMGLGYEAAAFAMHCAGEEAAARELCDAALAFDPASPTSWTLRGVLTSGSPEAAEAFKKAVERGDRTYFPYYYLANDALARGDFQAALDWSRQALERGERQDAQIKSLLYQWSAISLAQLGAPRDEVEGLFRKAIEATPDSELAKENFRRFQASERPEPPPPINWKSERLRPTEEWLIREQENSLFQCDRNGDQIQRRLAALAS
jgi:tetratricopeptide (TPR) repeat protein